MVRLLPGKTEYDRAPLPGFRKKTLLVPLLNLYCECKPKAAEFYSSLPDTHTLS